MPGTPATTPIHGAPRIANTDTFDLARDLNGVADAFDATAVAYSSGLASARPATGVNNRWYYATDTRQWSRYTTGGGWENPAPSAHAASHQDGGTDALTVREAMLATGATGPAKGSFSAFRNAAAGTGTSVALVCDAEDYDVSNWHDITTGRYTPQVAGYYRLSAHIYLNGVAVGQWVAVDLYKNGAQHRRFGVQHSNNAGVALGIGSSACVQANGTTDFFNMLWSASATTSPISGAANTYFQGELIGRS